MIRPRVSIGWLCGNGQQDEAEYTITTALGHGNGLHRPRGRRLGRPVTGYIPAAARPGVDIKKAMAPGRQATSSFIFSFGRRVRIILYRRIARVTGVAWRALVWTDQLHVSPPRQRAGTTPQCPGISDKSRRCTADKPAVAA